MAALKRGIQKNLGEIFQLDTFKVFPCPDLGKISATLHKAQSRPFAPPAPSKLAVAVINRRGDEILKVLARESGGLPS